MGSAATDKKHRQRLRRKLEALGYNREQIDRQVQAMRDRQAERRAGAVTGAAYLARLQQETYERLALDDRRYRPSSGDSLKHGAARATGATAKAIGRRKALTKHEYDRLQEATG